MILFKNLYIAKLKILKMKRVVFIVICIIGSLVFVACGSTAPCGLSQLTKKIEQNHYQQEILTAEIEIEK